MRSVVYCSDAQTFIAAMQSLGFPSYEYFTHSSGKIVAFVPHEALAQRKLLASHPDLSMIPNAHSQMDVSGHVKALKLNGKSAYDVRKALYAEIPVEELNPDY